MKLSATAVRQSRIERGWSQEQLAIASGLSLRTVQRVESEGIASLSTASSLAATFSVPLLQLQELPVSSQPQHPGSSVFAMFYLGLVVLMLAAIGESGRLPSDPMSSGILATDILVAVVGATLAIPAGFRLLRSGLYAGVLLAVVGIPLVTLLCGGLLVSALVHRFPLWQLLGIGACGLALVAMSVRAFWQSQRPGPNNSSKPTPLRGAA
ncbi:hypothetical protein PAGU2595_028780 [Lysobacter xanthus]